MESLIEDVLHWGYHRGLHDTNDLMAQMTKLSEELGEVAAGVARDDPERIMDAIGDMLVVMINMGEVFDNRYPGKRQCSKYFIEDCLQAAWLQIRLRTGKTVNGVFIKSGESK